MSLALLVGQTSITSSLEVNQVIQVNQGDTLFATVTYTLPTTTSKIVDVAIWGQSQYGHYVNFVFVKKVEGVDASGKKTVTWTSSYKFTTSSPVR